MAILEPSSFRDAPPRQHTSRKRLSLTLLTFQNSALILVMHYSRIMPMSGDHRYFTSTAVFLNEIIKLSISLTLAMYETSKTLAPSTPASVMFEQIFASVFSGDGWKLAVPAAFYTLQNLLQYVAVENLDAVHFQVLYQLKILTTALFSVVLLNRPLGLTRWLSLIILTIGCSIVSLPSDSSPIDTSSLHSITEHFFRRSLQNDPSNVELELMRRSASYEGIQYDQGGGEANMNYSVGFTAVLVAAAISGLTGVYFEKLLKESPSQASVWVRNVQLSFYSLLAALFGGVFWQEGAEIKQHGFFDGYNSVVWTTILLQAAGGLIASVVIRDADNIMKNFATSISIVVSFFVSVYLFDFSVTFTFIFGTSLVLLAIWLYGAPDRHRHQAPAIRIADFEKPAIERTYTPGTTPRATTPRSMDPRRLNMDPFDARSLAMTTSRPSSPTVLPRQLSRSHLPKQG